MTSRSRGKRDQTNTPSGGGSDKPRRGRRSAGGKASTRPPRVSRPPSASDTPKKKAAPAKPARSEPVRAAKPAASAAPAKKATAKKAAPSRGRGRAAPQNESAPFESTPAAEAPPTTPLRIVEPRGQRGGAGQGANTRGGESAGNRRPPAQARPAQPAPARNDDDGQWSDSDAPAAPAQPAPRRAPAPAPAPAPQRRQVPPPAAAAPQQRRPQQQQDPRHGSQQGHPRGAAQPGQRPPQGQPQRSGGAPQQPQNRAPVQQGQRPMQGQPAPNRGQAPARPQQPPMGGAPRPPMPPAQRGPMPQQQRAGDDGGRPRSAPSQRPAQGPPAQQRGPAPMHPAQQSGQQQGQQPQHGRQQRPPQQQQRPAAPVSAPTDRRPPAPQSQQPSAPASRAPMPPARQGPPAPSRNRQPESAPRPAPAAPSRERADRDGHDKRDAVAPRPAPAPTQKRPVQKVVSDASDPTFNQKAFDEIFERGKRFADLGLAPEVLRGVTEAGFEYPTTIQAKLIPLLLEGKDLLGQAKTGTGKTAAFGLPLLSRLTKGDAMSGMVLVPTRELAIQVATDLNELGKYTGFHVLPVYGGQNINTQAQRLHEGPEIIVATPGRLQDMRERGYVNYRNIKTVILDEVDRMLDIGFRDDIRRILSACPADRQTVFVSATLPAEVESLARSFARDAEKIVATTGSLTASLVKQWYLPAQPWDKKPLLLHLLKHESPALTIIFCRTKRTVDSVAEYLSRKGIDTMAIHGDMPQSKRNRVIEKLHAGSLSVLVASDLASRGLDVEGITHVINYDLPEDPDLYIHRIGRTARAGRDGVAWSLVTPEQGPLLTEIEILINAEIPKLDYPDFVPGPVPDDVRARMPAPRRTDGPKPVSRFAGPVHAPTAAALAMSTASAPAPSGGPSPRPAQVAAPALDPSRFPGGIIPSKLPDRRMGGRVKTARSMRQGPAPVAPPPPAEPSAG